MGPDQRVLVLLPRSSTLARLIKDVNIVSLTPEQHEDLLKSGPRAFRTLDDLVDANRRGQGKRHSQFPELHSYQRDQLPTTPEQKCDDQKDKEARSEQLATRMRGGRKVKTIVRFARRASRYSFNTRWDETTSAVSVFRHPSGNANGNARDRTGRLVTCEHSARRVTRTEYDGSITVIVDRFQGKRLNSPNDVVVASDGAIWFTDPPFGLGSFYEGTIAEPELNANIYRVRPADGRSGYRGRRRLGAERTVFLARREASLCRRVPRGTEPQDPRVRRGRWALSRGQPGADRRRSRNARWFSDGDEPPANAGGRNRETDFREH